MLKIGWASRDVSENGPVFITGQAHERISTGSVDPTTITVLVMDDSKDNVIFVSADFTSISGSLYKETKEAVAKKNAEINCEKIIMNATHTHTAPRYQSLGELGYDKAPLDRIDYYDPEKYRSFLVDNISDAIIEAYEKREEGSFSYGYGSAVIGVSRRVNYFNDRSAGNNSNDTFAVNGFGAMYGDTNIDDFSGYEGASDSQIYLLYTFDKNQNLTGAVVNVNCPSQCTEAEEFTSADYWNETRDLIREKYGNIYILPQCAAAGDQSPHLLHGREKDERMHSLKFANDPLSERFLNKVEFYNRKVIAERIAHAFDECFSWASKEKIENAPIKHTVKTVALDAWKITKEEYESAKLNYELLKNQPFVCTDDPLEDFKANTILSSNLRRYEVVVDRYESNADYKYVELHILKIGDIAFATNPFELYTDYQHRIQARSPFMQTFIIQLASPYVKENPGSGYLPTPRAAFNKGYSAIMFSCNVSPEGGRVLVDKTLEELNNIK